MDWPNKVPQDACQKIGPGVAHKYGVIPIAVSDKGLVLVCRNNLGDKQRAKRQQALEFSLNSPVEILTLQDFPGVEQSQFNEMFDKCFGGELRTVIANAVSTPSVSILYLEANADRAALVEEKLFSEQTPPLNAFKVVTIDNIAEGIEFLSAHGASLGTVFIAFDFDPTPCDAVCEIQSVSNAHIYIVTDQEYQISRAAVADDVNIICLADDDPFAALISLYQDQMREAMLP